MDRRSFLKTMGITFAGIKLFPDLLREVEANDSQPPIIAPKEDFCGELWELPEGTPIVQFQPESYFSPSLFDWRHPIDEGEWLLGVFSGASVQTQKICGTLIASGPLSFRRAGDGFVSKENPTMLVINDGYVGYYRMIQRSPEWRWIQGKFHIPGMQWVQSNGSTVNVEKFSFHVGDL